MTGLTGFGVGSGSGSFTFTGFTSDGRVKLYSLFDAKNCVFKGYRDVDKCVLSLAYAGCGTALSTASGKHIEEVLEPETS